MSSYNDNLQSTVLASLNSQQLDEKKTQATFNASVFTLYYAQAATNTAADKLELAQDDLQTAKAPAKEQAVHSSNICNNLLASAGQANNYIKQTITNTAVCASNVQIAANAIMRLASDIGGVYSIVNASDFHGPIYNLTKQAYEQINSTAYNAELASQYAMEASTLTAEVSVPTVNDKAKAVKTAMDSLLGIVTSEFDTASETARAANVTLSALNAKEKLAEGVLEDVNVDLYATQSAYTVINKELNINLLVPANQVTNNTFTVSFRLLKSPFDQDLKEIMYPVEHYYIMIVKESKKSTFSLNNAETFVTDQDTSQFVKVTHFKTVTVPDISEIAGKGKTIRVGGTETIKITQVNDSDGETLQMGKSYVAFVFAQYHIDYKKKINSFEDYLSAPSFPFIMASQLKVADAASIKVVENKANIEDTDDNDTLHPATNELTFNVKDEDNTVQYRCMFLPDDKSITKGLLTYGGLRNLENEVTQLENIAFTYDPLIAQHEAEYNNTISVAGLTASELSKLTALQTTYTNQIKDAPDKEKEELQKKLDALNKPIKTNTDALTAQKISIAAIKKELDKAIAEKNAAINAVNPKQDSKLGFYFDVTIAEQISYGNYIVANEVKEPKDETPAGTKDATAKPTDNGVNYLVKFDNTATDNFGNLLITGNTYIPVVLSIYNGNNVESLNSFVSGLSDYNKTTPFVYYAQKTTD